MPRSGYDTTNMRVAANPRPAGSAAGTGKPKNDKPSGGGNSNGCSGSGNGSGGGRGLSGRGKGKSNGRADDDAGSKGTTELEPEPGRENKDGEPTSEKPTDDLHLPWKDVRIQLEGRGWTFWL